MKAPAYRLSSCGIIAILFLLVGSSCAQTTGRHLLVTAQSDAVYTTVFSASSENGLVLGTAVLGLQNQTFLAFLSNEQPFIVTPQTSTFPPASLTHTRCVVASINSSTDGRLVFEATNYLRPPNVFCRNPPDYLDDNSISSCRTSDPNPGGFLPDSAISSNSGMTNQNLTSDQNYTLLAYNEGSTTAPLDYTATFRPEGVACGAPVANASNSSDPVATRPVVQIFAGYSPPGSTGARTSYFTNATCAKISTTLVDSPTSGTGGTADVYLINLGPKQSFNRNLTGTVVQPQLVVSADPRQRNAQSFVVTMDPGNLYTLYSALRATGTRNLTLVHRVAMLNQQGADCGAITDSYVGIGSLSPAAAPPVPAVAPALPPVAPPTPPVTPARVSPPPTGPATTMTQAASGPSTSSGISGGAIGGIVGGVLAAVIVAVVGFFLWRRRTRSRRADTKTSGRDQYPAYADPYGQDHGGLHTQGSPGLKNVASLLRDDSNSLSKESETTGSNPSGLSPIATSNSTDSRSHSRVASFAAVKAMDRQQPAYLPIPKQLSTGSQPVEEGIATVHLATGSSSNVPSEERGSRNELEELWKIEPSSLHCRCHRDGTPIHLGEGGCGKVYLGVLDRQDVAVKLVTSRTSKQQERFLREIMTLRACTHPHVVQFIGACARENEMCLVMEYMVRGDLYSKLKTDDNKEYGWYNKGALIAMDTIRGMIYLHRKGIAHLDLKSPNIMLTANDRAKIGDVGLGKIISVQSKTTAEGGSLLWAAPEQLLGGKVGTAADIYAFGVVLWEICTGDQIFSRFLRDIDVPSEAPQSVVDIFASCHHPDPNARPSATTIFDRLSEAVNAKA